MNTGKCTKCGEVLNNIKVEPIKLSWPTPFMAKCDGLSYVCPSCSAILSVGVNPLTLQEELVNEADLVSEAVV